MSRRWVRWGAVAVMAVLPFVAVLLAAPLLAQAPEAGEAAEAAVSEDVVKWAFASAAAVAGISALGAAYAVAAVGGAAMGAVAEKPETAGRAIVFVGLAEGIAIYGLIIAIMILGRV